MAVIAVEIRSREPFAGGQAFGETGAYERIDAVLTFAVDPADPANAGIVDLGRAARDGQGRVRFAADLTVLQPTDGTRGRRLLLDVPNRGRRVASTQINRARPEPVPTAAIDPGDGFLFRHGWTVAWCGWQWDVARGGPLLGLTAPEARDGDGPLRGQARLEFQPNAPAAARTLSDRDHAPYPAADLDERDALLTVRDHPHAPRTVIARDRWRFARDEQGCPSPDATSIWLKGGFRPGLIYEVTYTTDRCPVVGVGLLAIRDVGAFLRFGEAAAGNPCAGGLDSAYAFGVSQCGRFLRTLLHLGLNRDEAGRTVYDGMLIHIAGARRGEFNHRYAQPSVQYSPSFGHLPPFATLPVDGAPGLFDRQRARGGMPKVVMTNTAAEYWRADAALGHVEPTGRRDLPPDPDARLYLVAGTQHPNGALPLTDFNPLDGSRGAHPFNALDYTAAVRAALINLERWVAAGTPPPPDRHPRLADGTLVPVEQALAAFDALPGATVPDPERLRRMTPLDLGPADAVEAGIGRYPPVAGEPYPFLVSAVDGDGNETGGIRLPDVAVPLATYAGWNPRHPATGGQGQILSMMGSTLPFARTEAERQATGDPRPSIAARYPTREKYLDAVRDAAVRLVEERVVLEEDVPALVEQAARRWQAFAG